MSKKMSQKEYLKKYLSGGSDKKKKKKSKHKSTTVRIIDDDVHGDHHPDIDEELLLTGEDAPQIVGIIDASGAANGESKWKSISGVKVEENPEPRGQGEDDLWGKKATSLGSDRSPNRRKPRLDLSPPRKARERKDFDQSPPRRRNHANGNKSPPRRRSPNSHSRRDSDQSPARRHQARRDSDQSPPRRSGQSRRDLDQSPPRERVRRDSDQSPPRRRQGRKDSDQSPPRRRNLDQSPPRERMRKDSDQSPRRSRRDSDQSPPRRRSSAGRNSGARMRKDSDHSPPRRTRWGSDQRPPPPQRNPRHEDDLSPVRVKRENPFNRSPSDRRTNGGNPFKMPIKREMPSVENSPRRHRPPLDESPVQIKRERRSDSPPPTHKNSGKMTKTLDGKRAGLQDARTLKHETEERRRNEDKMFSQMSAEMSGRDAEVQVRQSSAYRRRRKEEDPEVQRKKEAHEKEKKELYDRWNKGLKQIEAYKAKVSDDQYESSKPLARYSNDADLDEMLKQQERDDDPMLEYMRSKRKEHQKAANIPVLPKYKGSFPENRFNIPPGYRWDGVDRSNGYERKWFDVQNQKKALADEAYKYSTEDM